ncbi:MAG: hypothetical protein JO108_06760 [Acidobacteriaceae bacterium]|nr:hypothetical protein [Acidobacteriaceae bacterium]
MRHGATNDSGAARDQRDSPYWVNAPIRARLRPTPPTLLKDQHARQEVSSAHGIFPKGVTDVRIGEIGIRDVACAAPDTRVIDAARIMRERHVGDVVVIEQTKKGRSPSGSSQIGTLSLALWLAGWTISTDSCRHHEHGPGHHL